MSAEDDLLIASMISDTRVESSYDMVTGGGVTSTVRIVEFPTIDDLMLTGMKAVAAGIKFTDVEYNSVMDRNLVTQLVRTQVPTTRNS